MTNFASLVFLVLTAPTPAAPAERNPPDYYPLKVGTTWQYSVSTEQGKVPVTSTIAKVEKIDGVELARLECEIGGKVVGAEHLSRTDKGIYRHRINGIALDPPLCLLKTPVKEDESWESEIKVGKPTFKFACKVLGQEEVTVPSGKYKTVKTQIETEENGKKVVILYWFAPNVGVVKQTLDNGGMKSTMELEKFEMGK